MSEPVPIERRFWSKVSKTDDCWNWLSTKDARGYGRIWDSLDSNGRRKSWLAHKWLWEWENGLVPDGLELDHLCRNQGCVRPDHLEPVTHAENLRRYFATYTCKGDHEPEWYIEPSGARRCRSCIREYNRTYIRPNPERDRVNARERQRRYIQRKKQQRMSV